MTSSSEYNRLMVLYETSMTYIIENISSMYANIQLDLLTRYLERRVYMIITKSPGESRN